MRVVTRDEMAHYQDALRILSHLRSQFETYSDMEFIRALDEITKFDQILDVSFNETNIFIKMNRDLYRNTPGRLYPKLSVWP